MTLNQATQRKVYDRLRSFDGLELAGHESVTGSIASVLSEGEVLADTGEQYSSVQEAVDNSTTWTFIGPGTYYESVDISNADFTLQGAGEDTLIDGGTEGHAIRTTRPSVKIMNLAVRTDPSSSHSGITSGNTSIVQDCVVKDAGLRGIVTVSRGEGNITIVKDCRVEQCGDHGIRPAGTQGAIVSGCYVTNTGSGGITANTSNTIVTDCLVTNTASRGIWMSSNAHDYVIIGNRVHSAGSDGIHTNGIDGIIANNRISDSTNSDISNSGTNTVLDANLTGTIN